MTGIPKPKVAIIDSPVPNALATGRNPNHALVAVTTGILDQLDEPEMQAVLVQLSHVIHRDIAVMAMASFFATIASFIVQMGLWGCFGGHGDDRDRDRGGSGAFIVIFVLLRDCALTCKFLLSLFRFAPEPRQTVYPRPGEVDQALFNLPLGLVGIIAR